MQSKLSQQHIALSRLYPYKSPSVGMVGREGSEEPPIAWYIRSFVSHQPLPFNVLFQHLLTKTKVNIKDLMDNPWAPVCPLSHRTPKPSV